MNAAGAIGAKLQGMADRRQAAVSGKAKARLANSRLGEAGRGVKNRFAVARANRRANGRISRAIDNSKIGRMVGLDRGAAAAGALVDKEQAEMVGNVSHQLQRASIQDPRAADKALEAALKSGDTVAAQAAQNVLFAQGSSGMKRFYSTVSAAEKGGTANAKAVSALRENINTNHGQMVKGAAADISSWASQGGTLEGRTNDAATWANMSDADIANQKGDSLLRAADAGHLSGQQAMEVLNNQRLSQNLDDKSKQALALATYDVSTDDAPEASTPEPAPAQPQGNQTLRVDHSGRQTPEGASPDYHDRMSK
jgi:hypothetical protein